MWGETMSKNSDFKYPFDRQRPSRALQRSALTDLLAQREARSGSREPPNELDTAFIERQRGLVEHAAQPSRRTVPKWVYARIERRTPPSAIASDVIERLRRAPSERGYREAGELLNELGRRRGGARLVRELVTQELVDEFLRKGE